MLEVDVSVSFEGSEEALERKGCRVSMDGFIVASLDYYAWHKNNDRAISYVHTSALFVHFRHAQELLGVQSRIEN